jgi:hypothetical protein
MKSCVDRVPGNWITGVEGQRIDKYLWIFIIPADLRLTTLKPRLACHHLLAGCP